MRGLGSWLALVAWVICSACGSADGGGARPVSEPTVSPTPAMSPTASATAVPTPLPSASAGEPAGLAWAVGGRSVLRSDDGGVTWSVARNNVQPNALAFVDRKDGWIVEATTDGGHLLHTLDGGRSWQDEIGNLPGPAPLFFDVAVLDARHAVAVGSENGFVEPDFHRGPPLAVVTSDGGATWARAPLVGVDLGPLGEVALGSVYITLGRLEHKGLVTSRLGEPTAERGGRAKTYFKVTAKGLREVRQAQKTLVALWRGVPRLEGGLV